MKLEEIRALTTKAADNAIALAVIDTSGNVVVRYFDRVVVNKDAKQAAMLMETIGVIMKDAELNAMEASKANNTA